MAVPKVQSHSAPGFLPDDRQREAITELCSRTNAEVVAGAGTGKTSVLIHRVARLVQQGNARPEEVPCAHLHRGRRRQMRDRVGALLGKKIHSATFHDYC